MHGLSDGYPHHIWNLTITNNVNKESFDLFHFRKVGGSQIKLRKLEGRAISPSEQLEAINSLKSTDHDFLSFFVCRNPVEKLLSVYNYLLYQTQQNGKIFGKFPRQNPPSWEEYIGRVGAGQHDGLSDSVFEKCSPCTFHCRH